MYYTSESARCVRQIEKSSSTRFQECILNAESRASKPDLFIPEEVFLPVGERQVAAFGLQDDFVVDYFDINCHLQAESCPAGTQLSAVRSTNAALAEGDGSLHVIESVTGGVGECMSKCYQMAPEKCRSFNYDKEANVSKLSLYIAVEVVASSNISKMVTANKLIDILISRASILVYAVFIEYSRVY